jgi:hypothetical protein
MNYTSLIFPGVDNLNNVIHEARRHFRNKKKAYLRAKIGELKTVRSTISGTCLGASVALRRVNNLELIQ